MNNKDNIHGFLPGGEDRVQWIFEGTWTDEMMLPLLGVVKEHICAIRKNHGFDVTNFFEFSYADIGDTRVFYATRYQWRFLLSAFTIDELIEKISAEIGQ